MKSALRSTLLDLLFASFSVGLSFYIHTALLTIQSILIAPLVLCFFLFFSFHFKFFSLSLSVCVFFSSFALSLNE